MYLHDDKYFTKAELKQRAKDNGFTALDPIEKFLWDCEIASLLQSYDENIILKGGAAVQMHLPLNLQRASVDIDLIMNITQEQFETVLDSITHDEKYDYKIHRPKNPQENIPLKTYFIKTPSILESTRENNEIKIDALYEECNLPLCVLTDVETFALTLKKIKTYKKTTLIGDKLLTLGENSVGVIDQSSYPKQVYDVYNLLTSINLDKKALKEIIQTVDVLSEKEIKYREYKGTILSVLEDILICLNTHSQIDTSKYNGKMRGHIHGFQSLYLSSEQRKVRQYDWSIRFNHIRFLSEILLKYYRGDMSVSECVDVYNRATILQEQLKYLQGDAIKGTITRILKHCERVPYFKELKAKPILRVYWDVVTPDKLEALVKDLNL